MIRVFAIVLLVLSAWPAAADPVGTFDVVGTNPGSTEEYRGTVTVSRRGDVYEVVWMVGGTRFDGTGLGAKVADGQFLMGRAEEEDIAIAVGYVSGSSFGIAMYFEKADGSWEGVWTSGGSDKVASERWTPR